MARSGAATPNLDPTPEKPKARRAKPKLAAVTPPVEPAPQALDDESLRLDARPDRVAARRLTSRSAIKPPSRAVVGGVLAACVTGALVVGAGQALTTHTHRLHAVAPLAAAPQAGETAATPIAPAAEAKPILADYRPPDRDEVLRAYAHVAEVYRTEGLSGVVRQTMDCFAGLGQSPSYSVLDYCIALDAYGEAMQRKLAGEQPVAADSYFAAAQPRELAAARAVVGADGDPAARVLDVRRLAGEVSQTSSPAAAAAVVAANDHLSAHAAPALAQEQPPSMVHTGPARSDASPTAAPLAPVAKAVVAPTPSRPAKPRLEKAAAPAAAAKPRLQRTAAPAPAARPKLVKTAAHGRAKPAAVVHIARAAPTERAEHRARRMAAERPPLRNDHAQVVRTATTRTSKPSGLRRFLPPWLWGRPAHAAPDRDNAPPPWRVASRERPRPEPRDRLEPVFRRAAEPTEWVDCRQPRGEAELRLCEGPVGGGDGTLGGQYRSAGRNR
jgi:hypothetical protein